MSAVENTLQQDVKRLVEAYSPRELINRFQRTAFTYKVFGIGAFLLSFSFVADLFTGSLLEFMHWGVGQWVMCVIALVVTLALTLGQDATYDTGGNSQLFRIGKIALICFALFSEISQTMERENVGAQERGANTEEFKALVNRADHTVNTSTYIPAYVQDARQELADAKLELERCNRHAAKGQARVDQCVLFEKKRIAKAQGVLAGYETDRKADADAQIQANAANIEKAYELRHDDKNRKGMVQFIAGLLGVSGIFASFLFAVFIILPYEIMYYVIGTLKRALALALRHYGLNTKGHNMNSEYESFGVATTTAPVSAFDKIATATNNLPETIGNEMMQAQHARNQLHESLTEGAEKIGDKLDHAAASYRQKLEADGVVVPDDSDMDKPASEHVRLGDTDKPTPAPPKMSVADTITAIGKQAQASGANTEADIQAAVFAAYASLDNPMELSDGDLLKVAARISSKPDKTISEENPSSPATPKPQGTGRHNPALGSHEENYELPLPQGDAASAKTALTPSAEGSITLPSQPSAEGQKVDLEPFYQEWRALVQGAQIRPTIPPAKRWISERDLVKGIKHIEALAVAWLDRAKREGVLIDNPDGGKGKAKYVLA